MKIKRLFPSLLTILVLAFQFSPLTYAENMDVPEGTEDVIKPSVSIEGKNGGWGYEDYIGKYGTVYGADEIKIDCFKSDTPYEISPGMLLKSKIEVPKDGLYELILTYKGKDRKDLLLSLEIDGQVPFAEAESLIFPLSWVDHEKKRTDGNGNEIAPEQIPYDGFVSVKAKDYTGQHTRPYAFYLKAGTCEITLKAISGSSFIQSVVFDNCNALLTYDEWLENQNITDLSDEFICIEGENPILKSDSSLIPLSDNTSPLVSPSNPVRDKLNYIGGSNWSKTGDSITWSFNVKTSGYYRLGFKYRQNIVLGGVSYRRMEIDGNPLFEEAERIKFPYTNKWKYAEFNNGKYPYLIYLDKGQHTLSLEVTTGELSTTYSNLKKITSSLGDLYVDITMVIGETVDIQRSYELFNQIPNFNERLDQNIGDLENVIDEMGKVQGQASGSNIAVLRTAIQILRKMRDNPYSAHGYKDGFYNSYTSLCALMNSIVEMPLDIDAIYLIGNKTPSPDLDCTIIERVWFSLRRFLATFQEDYNSVSSAGDSNSLTIWVNWGRDQAQALIGIIKDGFETQHNTKVEVKVANASLIQAILAQKGPDCMLQMARTEPVNLAMRGALVDLSGFTDFDEVIGRFTANAIIPYQYENGVYALPDTQNFYMLFARTDILDRLGLEIPKTWDEFLYVLTVLQRNNLQAYLPYTQITDSTVVNTGVGGLTLFPTFLLQNGQNLYNSKLTASNLTEPDVMQTFVQWTEFYTKYKLPKTMDFYNRFRIGSAPIGIASYTLGTQIKAAAPEIEGRWTMREIPGVKNADGALINVSAGSGTGCSITKLSKNQGKAWEFVKWWTSAETQVRYSNNLESLLGPLGRVPTATKEALDDMSWDSDMLQEIRSQMGKVIELPELPGSYYVSRGIDQAFWNVTELNRNAKDTLLEWGAIVDDEIARKIQEYKNQ